MAESYSTIYRAMGISIGASLGRLAAAVGPFIIYPIYKMDNRLPFLYFTILCICGLICILTYPLETT